MATVGNTNVSVPGFRDAAAPAQRGIQSLIDVLGDNQQRATDRTAAARNMFTQNAELGLQGAELDQKITRDTANIKDAISRTGILRKNQELDQAKWDQEMADRKSIADSLAGLNKGAPQREFISTVFGEMADRHKVQDQELKMKLVKNEGIIDTLSTSGDKITYDASGNPITSNKATLAERENKQLKLETVQLADMFEQSKNTLMAGTADYLNTAKAVDNAVSEQPGMTDLDIQQEQELDSANKAVTDRYAQDPQFLDRVTDVNARAGELYNALVANKVPMADIKTAVEEFVAANSGGAGGTELNKDLITTYQNEMNNIRTNAAKRTTGGKNGDGTSTTGTTTKAASSYNPKLSAYENIRKITSLDTAAKNQSNTGTVTGGIIGDKVPGFDEVNKQVEQIRSQYGLNKEEAVAVMVAGQEGQGADFGDVSFNIERGYSNYKQNPEEYLGRIRGSGKGKLKKNVYTPAEAAIIERNTKAIQAERRRASGGGGRNNLADVLGKDIVNLARPKTAPKKATTPAPTPKTATEQPKPNVKEVLKPTISTKGLDSKDPKVVKKTVDQLDNASKTEIAKLSPADRTKYKNKKKALDTVKNVVKPKYENYKDDPGYQAQKNKIEASLKGETPVPESDITKLVEGSQIKAQEFRDDPVGSLKDMGLGMLNGIPGLVSAIGDYTNNETPLSDSITKALKANMSDQDSIGFKAGEVLGVGGPAGKVAKSLATGTKAGKAIITPSLGTALGTTVKAARNVTKKVDSLIKQAGKNRKHTKYADQLTKLRDQIRGDGRTQVTTAELKRIQRKITAIQNAMK